MTLQEFFAENSKVALGFSGGVDSSYLLYAAKKYGADIKPYFIKGAFQPSFEMEDAKKVAEFVGADNLTILHVDVLQDSQVTANDPMRCYYCKNNVFGLIKKQAAADGYDVIIDGTNASDDMEDRKGAIALAEMKVLSPLRLAGMTKDEIRVRSKEAGLSTWNKPSYACLATRIPVGTEIKADVLEKVEKAEGKLMELGYSDFRVRVLGTAAKLQLKAEQMPRLLSERRLILDVLQEYFSDVYLDLKER